MITLLEGLKFFREEKENLGKKVDKVKQENGTMKSPNKMIFEEKISFCPEDLNSFSSFCKEMHDVSHCYIDPCFVNIFCDELFSYAPKRRSLRKENDFLIDPCAKYHKAFDDIFTAVRHKKFVLEYFANNNKIQRKSR